MQVPSLDTQTYAHIPNAFQLRQTQAPSRIQQTMQTCLYFYTPPSSMHTLHLNPCGSDTLCHAGHCEVSGRASAQVLHMELSAEVVEGEEGVGEHQILGVHGSGDE